jgi:TonB family protein
MHAQRGAEAAAMLIAGCTRSGSSTPPAGPKRPHFNGLQGLTTAIPDPPVPLLNLSYQDPPGWIRRGEEGSSILQVCVAATGALAATPTLETSAGYARLDSAALKWAREALRFTPAQRDGKAVTACKGFRVTFGLNIPR